MPSTTDNPLSYSLIDGKLITDRSVGTTEYSLNGQMYEIQLYITNGKKVYPIAPTAIVDLSIEDTVSNWITQGTLTIYYANELAEYLNGFAFTNDGEDLLRLRIIPRDLAVKGLPSLNINNNKHLWELNHLFSIYNVEDVTPPSGGNSPAKMLKKFKKFYFWDIRYQIMLTKNIEYSTALSEKAPISKDPNLPATDENRSIKTGVAINEIIKTALNENPLLSRTGADPDPEVNSEIHWDDGGRDIFYTSGAASNSFEDLDYVRSRHISSTMIEKGVPDFCLLSTQRSKDGLSFFTLVPFSKIFANAGTSEPGEDQIEHFFLYADAKEEAQGITTYRAPRSENTGDVTKDITLRDFSFITSYEFVDISPIVNASNFISYSVHSFDFAKRTFNIEFQNHSYKTAQKIFQEKYISQLFTNGKSGNNNFLLNNYNLSKQTNYSVMPTFNPEGDSTKPEIRAISGLYQLLYTGLFQNTCINFTVPGISLRQAGKFIAIDRPDGSSENSLDDKLCGQWFVINVVHTISNGAYYNNITAVKIHRYKPLSSTFTNQFGTPAVSTPIEGTNVPIA